MKTRINSKIGGISKALYIPADGSNPEMYYNAGKAGVDYRFLEYSASYLVSDSSDFNILENMTREKLNDFFGTPTPGYDGLENLYNTAIPCGFETLPGTDYNKYFGSFIVDQKSIYVFLVPEGISKIRVFQDILRDPDLPPIDESEFNDPLLDCDLLIDFTESSIEVSEAKVVYIAITQANRDNNREIRVGYKAWLQLINPVRRRPDSLLSVSDSNVKVQRVEKRGNVWYDAVSGSILGTSDVSASARGKILERKRKSLRPQEYSPWKVYQVGEKAIYPEASRIDLGGNDLDITEKLPAGEICLYGDCTVSDIQVNSESIWFYRSTLQTGVENGKATRYLSSTSSSILYRTTDENLELSVERVSLEGVDKDKCCIKFLLSTESVVRIICQHSNRVGGGTLVIESPKDWISLRNRNIGNYPSGISPWWSTTENLTNYYSQVTEICCPGGEIIPSGLINIKSDTTEIGARMRLKPGRDFDSSQDPGVVITKRLDPSGETYHYVSIEKYGTWKRRYTIRVTETAPDISFQFPVLIVNSNSGYTMSDQINISEFYKNTGTIDGGIKIDIKEMIKRVSTSYPAGIQSISEFLDTQEFEITPDFPGMTIGEDGVAEVKEVTVYSGVYQFRPKFKKFTILMANSYDFSVSNPYDYVDYGSIIDGLSFRSETGATPGWIWIDKMIDSDIPEGEDRRVKYSLSDLVSGRASSVVIDGRGYGFTKMMITKSGNEYRIKIEDIKNSIKIDIIEA